MLLLHCVLVLPRLLRTGDVLVVRQGMGLLLSYPLAYLSDLHLRALLLSHAAE